MSERVLTDPDVVPTDVLAEQQLGEAGGFYMSLVALTETFRKQWQFHKGKGWILKVDHKRKALCYVIPFDGRIEISLTVREGERAGFLANPAFEPLFPRLESAKKYPEGYALRFGIENPSELISVAAFLTELISLRSV